MDNDELLQILIAEQKNKFDAIHKDIDSLAFEVRDLTKEIKKDFDSVKSDVVSQGNRITSIETQHQIEKADWTKQLQSKDEKILLMGFVVTFISTVISTTILFLRGYL